MEVHDYIPRIFDGETDFIGSKRVDASKWNAIHKAIDNPGSEVVVRSWSSPGSLFNMAWGLGIVLGLIWVMRNGKTVFTQWQQNMYRRANRRRHGIPDDDNRPFNVAYAAAALARKERERAERQKLKPQVTNNRDRHPVNSLRFRQPISSEPISSIQPPALINRVSDTHDRIESFTLPGEYLPARQESQQRRFIQSNLKPTGENLLAGGKFQGKRDSDLISGNQNRATGPSKKHAPQREVSQIHKRGYKRPVDEEDRWETSLDKRVRVGSSSFEGRDQEDVEMGSPASDIEPGKGTKREREELESTPDSGADESDGSSRPRRIRQRREPSEKKEIEIANSGTVQGHKRRHSLEDSTASDDRERNDVNLPRPKRRHRAVIGHDTTESEAEDVKNYSEDPACAGRKIGEIWEVNGQVFKVGSDGRRLRQVLVKQRRTKFPMPRDSTHTDVKIDVEVYVEKWLNDEEYKVAKENFELAWQDSVPSTPTNGSIELRQSTGKRLLWDGPPKSPVKGRKSMLAASVQNPFDLAPSSASRRVSSVHMLAGLPAENPQLRASKSFSKWEKQDLEALSLKKMRVKMEQEKKEHEPVKQTGRVGGKEGSLFLGAASEKPSLSTKNVPATESAPGSTPVSAPAISESPAAPAQPALSLTKTQESKTTPAANTAFTFNKTAPDSQPPKTNTDSAPSSFNFVRTPPVPTAPSTSASTAQPNSFNFGPPAASSALAQSPKPDPPKSTFSFQPSTTAPESIASKPFGSLAPSTGTNPLTSTGSTPKPFSFGPQQISSGTTVQSTSPPAPAPATTSFNFAVPSTSGLEAPKFPSGNSFKAASESRTTPTAPTTSMSSTATTTAPTLGAGAATAPPSFNFGSTQSATTPFSFGKPSGNTTPFLASGTPPKPSGSQLMNPSFSRLGDQVSAPQFGGFGTSVSKADQATGTASFTFRAEPSSDVVKPTSTTASGEQAKVPSLPTPTESRTSMFQSPAETAPTKNIFGAFPSTGQNAFGGQTASESSKQTFGQPSQPTSAFGQGTEAKSAFGHTSDSKNIFGQPPQSKPVFGQPSESKNVFGQLPEGKSAFGQPSPNIFGKTSQPTSTFGKPSTFGQPSESKNVFGQTSAIGQSSESKSAFGQTFQPNAAFGQSSEPKNIFGQPSEPKTVFGQSSEPKSVFSQTSAFGKPSSTEAFKSSFGAPSTAQPTNANATFGPNSTSNADSKGIFGQAPKGVFGQQSSEPLKSAFSQTSVPTSSSTDSFGNPSTSGSSGTLGSSESGGSGFKFTFGGQTSTPSSFTGFGSNTTSGDKPSVLSQSKPTNNVEANSSTPLFGQTTSAFGPPSTSTSAFASPGAGGNAFGSSTFSFGQASQPGASTPSFGAQAPAPALPGEKK